jgi:hypothetical protein
MLKRKENKTKKFWKEVDIDMTGIAISNGKEVSQKLFGNSSESLKE